MPNKCKPLADNAMHCRPRSMREKSLSGEDVSHDSLFPCCSVIAWDWLVWWLTMYPVQDTHTKKLRVVQVVAQMRLTEVRLRSSSSITSLSLVGW